MDTSNRIPDAWAAALKHAVPYGLLVAAWIALSSWLSHQDAVPHGLARHTDLLLDVVFGGIMLALLFRLLARHHALGQVNREVSSQMNLYWSALETACAERQEARERFSIISGGIPTLIAHLDPEQRFLYVNGRYAEWAGRPEREIIGRSAREILGEEIYRDTQHCIDQVLQGRFACMERQAGLMGITRFQHLSFIPRFDRDNTVCSYFVLINDITELRQAEEQLRQAHKMEAIGTLAAGVAHDFNNLLTIIIGSAEMIESHEEQCLMGKKMILEAASRGAGLTGSLLAFSRRQEMEVARIDLNARIERLSTLLCRIIGKDITIRLSLGETPIEIMADAEQLDQVVMNLACNARDAMPDGGVLQITTCCSDRSLPVPDAPGAVRSAVLEVSDTGIGMDAATIERIFDPFYTTKGVGKGTGLGLAMAFGIIKKHNGLIEVESTPGDGTMFRIVLPLIDQAAGTDTCR